MRPSANGLQENSASGNANRNRPKHQSPFLSTSCRQEQFATTTEYVEALTTSKAQQIVQQQAVRKQQQELLGSYHDKEEAARDKYEDFEQVAYNPKLPITDVMAQTIQASDNGPEILRIIWAQIRKKLLVLPDLQPFLQAKEIGRLEAKVASEPITKQTSKAPAPISPVTPRNGGSTNFDTTDPRSIKAMSTSQWIEAERLRQMKKLEPRESVNTFKEFHSWLIAYLPLI
jgi:hypothetical protein